jgi:hypothetical protein
MMTTLAAAGSAAVRAAAVVPTVLLILFVGVLWILGLACGPDRRLYVTKVSHEAMAVIGILMHESPASLPRGRTPGD